MTRYWSDEAYAQFYQSSTAERGLVKTTAAASGDARREGGGAAGRRGSGRGGEPLGRRQLEAFQQAFAEWSGGRGRLRLLDFRQFLMQVRIELSVAQARSLWKDVAAKEDAQYLTYEEALLAYQQVLTAPVQFRSDPRAAPPGTAPPRALEGAAAEQAEQEAVAAAAEEAELQLQLQQQRRSRGRGAGGAGGASGAGGAGGVPSRDLPGGSLPVSQARDLLLTEGLPAHDVEALLRPFASAGAVRQATLFDYLAEWAGVPEGSRDGAPSSPAGRKSAACAPPAAPRAPPVLA